MKEGWTLIRKGRLFERGGGGAYKIFFVKRGRLFEEGAYLRGALIRGITVCES